jgi:polyisoprenoid-binding protein YceI
MKKFSLLLTLSLFIIKLNAQVYKAVDKKGNISFHSSTPMEDIDAKTESANSLLNSINDSVMVRVQMTTFKFPKALMEEHFNENYVESAKFPVSSFRGKINQKLDFKSDGVHKVTCTGNLTLHGVTKPVTFDGIITIKGEEVNLTSDFKIKLVDYNIEVPKIVLKNIAEEIEVKANITYLPFAKKK